MIDGDRAMERRRRSHVNDDAADPQTVPKDLVPRPPDRDASDERAALPRRDGRIEEVERGTGERRSND